MQIIEVKNLWKIYREGRVTVEAIKDVSLSVRKGEMVAIMGPSGSGKTTLLSMMGCILKPTEGDIIIKDLKLNGLDEENLPEIRSRYIGFIFQAFNLFHSLTASENVEVALNLKGIEGKEAEKESRKLLEKVGLREREEFLPRDMSGGEKQRVAIARALAGNPPLILADEPTGNLDSKTGFDVIKILKESTIKEGTSVVIVTHDVRIKEIVDRVLYLEDGKIVGEG
ncbi:MAG: ABC transporter ATP-binding protein [Nitrospirae bacterium]|nr:ABC transporter ATP-binding protein [Nitrospirota bacterium]